MVFLVLYKIIPGVSFPLRSYKAISGSAVVVVTCKWWKLVPAGLCYLDPRFKTSQLLIAGDKTFILHGSAFIQINYSLTV